MMHEIIVGNIGSVYLGSYTGARKAFYEYSSQSLTGYGRASGESVTWYRDNQIYREYFGANDRQEDGDD